MADSVLASWDFRVRSSPSSGPSRPARAGCRSGMSFGGFFSAHGGLTEVVGAGGGVGGPVLNACTPENTGRLIYGMRDILGNAWPGFRPTSK
jgi:hypothetical protein